MLCPPFPPHDDEKNATGNGLLDSPSGRLFLVDRPLRTRLLAAVVLLLVEVRGHVDALVNCAGVQGRRWPAALSVKRPELLRLAAARLTAGCTVRSASASSELLRAGKHC